jgi:hypothetical protein
VPHVLLKELDRARRVSLCKSGYAYSDDELISVTAFLKQKGLITSMTPDTLVVQAADRGTKIREEVSCGINKMKTYPDMFFSRISLGDKSFNRNNRK